MTVTALAPTSTTATPCPAWHDGCERIVDLDGAADLHRGAVLTAGTGRSAVHVRFSHLDVLGDQPTAEVRIGNGEAAHLAVHGPYIHTPEGE